ncbi:UNVERIFIED_ORG: hypothetical protein BDK47_1165 [Anoxybacillus amylolyticus]
MSTVQMSRFCRSQRGSLAIEIAVGMLMFVMVIAVMMDVLLLTWRFQVVSQTNEFVARTAQVQGGILSSAPTGFPGGEGGYVNSSEMASLIRDKFEKAGIEPGEYAVLVNGVDVGRGGSTGAIDYLQPIRTEIRIKYEWKFTSNLIPGAIENWLSSRRSVLSEFKYRYDSWVGE